jgi:hypothetical protein
VIVACCEKSDYCVTVPCAAFFSDRSSEHQSQIIEKNYVFFNTNYIISNTFSSVMICPLHQKT